MKRVLLLAATMAVIIPFAARAQGKPDFSGTWTLDTAKSDPAPAGRGGGGGGAATLTIKQTANELSVQSEGRQGPQTMTYKLDGSESKNEQMGRGGAQTIVSKAKWDGASLVIDTTREIQGMSITTHEVRKLDNGGKEMKVESTTQTPQGEIKRNVVYTKS
jgi:hypothetical protein